jgi:nucleotide-binding universal stress UspA family protein
MKILVALDDSPYSQQVIKAIARRKFLLEAQVKLLTVIEPLSESDAQDEVLSLINQKRSEAAKHLLEASRKKLTAVVPDANVCFEIRQGRAQEEILSSASQWGANLILVGAHGHGICPTHHGLDRVGTVSRGVAQRASCSVEVIRTG